MVECAHLKFMVSSWSKQTSKQAYSGMHNAIMLLWGSLRLVPINVTMSESAVLDGSLFNKDFFSYFAASILPMDTLATCTYNVHMKTQQHKLAPISFIYGVSNHIVISSINNLASDRNCQKKVWAMLDKLV